jgi:hypothetical protein
MFGVAVYAGCHLTHDAFSDGGIARWHATNARVVSSSPAAAAAAAAIAKRRTRRLLMHLSPAPEFLR